MKVLLAGLWARRGLNAAALLVTLTALTGAVLGPMYARASAEHLVDDRLGGFPTAATGLSLEIPAALPGDLPEEDPDRYTPPQPMDVVQEASDVVAGPGVDRFWGPERQWLRDDGGRLDYGRSQNQTPREYLVPLYWREGMCQLAELSGRCPSAEGEALMQATLARTLGVEPGDDFRIAFEDNFTERTRAGTVERSRRREVTFRIVGTYRITDPGSPQWYDEARFVGYERMNAPAPTGPQAPENPATPALLVAPASMTSQTFVGGVDRVIDRSALDLDGMAAAERALTDYTYRVQTSPAVDPPLLLQLGQVFEQVRAERALLSRVTTGALAPLVVLALLLLFALVSAGAVARRPHVGLAKLRGHSRGQILRFALAEPLLIVAVATPLAVGLGYLATTVIADLWFAPGVPVAMDTFTWVALTAVVLGAVLASVIAALDVIREPLARALSAAIGSRGSSRVGLVLRSAAVAVAVAVLVQLATSPDQSSQTLALLAPLFVALGVSVAGAVLLRRSSSWWVRRTTGGGGTPSYLASRRLARRADLANLMMPLVLAVSVLAFVASAADVSDDWRVSRARAEIGAPKSFLSDQSPQRLLHATREVDPEGRHLMAAVAFTGDDDMSRRLFVDATRLAQVGSWVGSWSEIPLSTLARRLAPEPGERLSFTGEDVSVSLRDVELESDAVVDDEPVLYLQYVDDVGEQRNAALGAVPNGAEVTVDGKVSRCREQCLVEKLFLAGPGLSVLDANGSLTLTGLTIDGEQVDWGLSEDGAWRAARPFPVSLVDAPVVLDRSGPGLTLTVYLGELPPGQGQPSAIVPGFAGITPATTPDIVPVVVAEGTETTQAGRSGGGTAIRYEPSIVAGTALSGDLVPMRVLEEVHALPLLGNRGAMADLETSLVEFEPPAGSTVLTQLWTTADTPARMLDELRARGILLSPIGQADTRLEELRSDAFSLGLRLFVVVGAVTLLLAIFGVFAGAVLQSRWRAYEVASLRVVGVRQRSLVRASVLEYVVMLGLAVVLGVASALLSVRFVLPTISLGITEEFEPAPIYSGELLILAGVGAGLFAVALLIALVVSVRITRLGRPATLRWAEQG